MIKKIIRNFLNKNNYEIIKQPYLGDLYPNLSNNKDEYYCETPIGSYYLPFQIEKDPVANHLARGKEFEADVLNIARKYIKKNTTTIDIGANFGHMSIAFSKLVGNGDVYAVEAQSLVIGLLKKTIEANKCHNIHLIGKAAYYEDYKTLYFPEIIKQISGSFLSEENTKGEAVKTITIDSLNIKTPVSFMKVDVEGADLYAMMGAKETILKNKMPIIFEFLQHTQEDFGTTFGSYVAFINSINYKFDEVVDKSNFVVLPNE